jgi:non-ribosomal peptide synthetase component E (peptide arylation enzyme)
MPVKIIPPTPSAYTHPLLIKHLLHAAMVRSPNQEIVYRDIRRRTYREFRERIGRLASGLSQIGVEQGHVVAVLEWDVASYVERGLIAKIAIPDHVAFVDDLPLTSVGKVDKKKLRANYV